MTDHQHHPPQAPHEGCPWVIRPYCESDLVAVAELFTASVHILAAREYNAAQRAAWAPRPPDLDAWRQRLSTLCTRVAEVGGQRTGFIAFEPQGYIDLLYTAPTHARRGVASALICRAAAELVAGDVEQLTTHASLLARPLFLRHGFHVVEEQFVERQGVVLPRYRMRKVLSTA